MGLRFDDAAVEEQYRAFLTDRVYRLAQIALLLGVLTYAIFGLWDPTLPGGGLQSTRFRYMIGSPVLAVFFALSFAKEARKHWHALMMGFTVAALLCVYETSILTDREAEFKLATGVASMSFFLTLAFVALLPIRFVYTIATGLMAQAAHLSLLLRGSLRTQLILLYCSDFASLFLIVCAISYYRERLLRREFLHQQNVLDEKDVLKNQLLSFVSLDALERAKSSGKPVADAFGEVTVIFCDIEGFTGLAERLAPKHLVEVLNDVFTALDHVAAECKVEKVKTIGDAYMAISGTSDESRNSAEDAAEFALRAHEQTAVLAEALGHPLAFRIGMHTGSLIGGVVGRQKMAYDYWGKTVNIASRLESTGVAGKVHVSETTYWRLSSNYVLEPRGKTELKGVGPMETYFLAGRKPQSSAAEV
jgi:class 3 adenylate cyclase